MESQLKEETLLRISWPWGNRKEATVEEEDKTLERVKHHFCNSIIIHFTNHSQNTKLRTKSMYQ